MKIVGTVKSPLYISNERGSSSLVVKEAEKHISEKEIFEIEKWISSKCEDASRKMEITNLPYNIGYG